MIMLLGVLLVSSTRGGFGLAVAPLLFVEDGALT